MSYVLRRCVLMNEWEYIPRVYCPSCGAFTLWAGVYQEHGRVAYCVRCEVRVMLKIIAKEAMSGSELAELADVRYLAGVDSNSAVGAF